MFLLYRYDEECIEAVPYYLKLKTVYFYRDYEVERFSQGLATLYLEEKENDASSFDLFVFVTLQAVEFR